jgi:hypothetical protein
LSRHSRGRPVKLTFPTIKRILNMHREGKRGVEIAKLQCKAKALAVAAFVAMLNEFDHPKIDQIQAELKPDPRLIELVKMRELHDHFSQI